MMDFNIENLTEYARYTECLESLLEKLGGKKVLRLDYESDYQGHVDVDVALEDGRVFSYYYDYGSCSGCDEWEDRDLSDSQIEKCMKQEATFFDNINQYNEWVKRKNDQIRKNGNVQFARKNSRNTKQP